MTKKTTFTRIMCSRILLMFAMLVLATLCISCGADNKDTDSLSQSVSSGDASADTEELPVEPEPIDPIEEWISTHTTEEKVAQLFMIRPEAILLEDASGDAPIAELNEVNEDGAIVAFDAASKYFLEKYPVGGIIYFKKNLKDPEQTKEMLSSTKEYAASLGMVPLFLGVDEEGGRVARIASNEAFGVENIGPAADIGAKESPVGAYSDGDYVGTYLEQLGFNVDMAPDADVLSNPENTVIGDRSFGSDPYLVAETVVYFANGLNSNGILPVLKHFPGHGDTAEDSHSSMAYTYKTMDELKECEFVPFVTAIGELDRMAIMVGHISTPNATGSDIPATMNEDLIQGYLRDEVGYDGLIITDAMNMGAISLEYTDGEACVKAIQAGCDVLLMPGDFLSAYETVLEAVNAGQISMERLDTSVRRILKAKQYS